MYYHQMNVWEVTVNSLMSQIFVCMCMKKKLFFRSSTAFYLYQLLFLSLLFLNVAKITVQNEPKPN